MRASAEPTIRPAGPADIEPVIALLHAKMDRRIPPARWRRLMTYPWLADKPDLGRVVEAGGQILGFVGMIYADRMIAGRRERVVNMSGWYLDKSLRGRGLGEAAMADAMRDPAMSYDFLTSAAGTLTILDRLGCRVLDDHRYVWRRRAPAGLAAGITVIEDIEAIRARAGAGGQALIDDHRDYPVRPVLLEAEGNRCLLFFSIKRKGPHVTWFDVLHASDRALLGRHGQALADAVLPEEAAVLAADCRFVAGTAVGAERERLPVPRSYKSSHLAPHEIDHLYSELQLLDLKLD